MNPPADAISGLEDLDVPVAQPPGSRQAGKASADDDEDRQGRTDTEQEVLHPVRVPPPASGADTNLAAPSGPVWPETA